MTNFKFAKTDNPRDKEEDKIELQDLLISLTILSRISQDSKLRRCIKIFKHLTSI